MRIKWTFCAKFCSNICSELENCRACMEHIPVLKKGQCQFQLYQSPWQHPRDRRFSRVKYIRFRRNIKLKFAYNTALNRDFFHKIASISKTVSTTSNEFLLNLFFESVICGSKLKKKKKKKERKESFDKRIICYIRILWTHD